MNSTLASNSLYNFQNSTFNSSLKQGKCYCQSSQHQQPFDETKNSILEETTKLANSSKNHKYLQKIQQLDLNKSLKKSLMNSFFKTLLSGDNYRESRKDSNCQSMQNSILKQIKEPYPTDRYQQRSKNYTFLKNLDYKSTLQEPETKEKLNFQQLLQSEKRLKSIKQQLRRKYCRKTNLSKMFEIWDSDCRGSIDATKIHTALNRMGLNITYQEADMLLKSADADNSKNLNMQEFMDLVFKDQFSKEVDQVVDGKSNPDLGTKDKQEQSEFVQGLEKQKIMEEQQKTKSENRNHLLLKAKIPELIQQFKIIDYCNDHIINYQEFVDIIRRCKITEKVISSSDLDKIFAENQIPNKKLLNYESFLQNLNTYQVKNIAEPKQDINLNGSNNSGFTQQLLKYKQYNANHSKNDQVQQHCLNQINLQAEKFTQLLKIRKNGLKIVNQIKRLKGSQKEFEDFIQNQLIDACNLDNSQSQVVNKDLFLNVIQDLMRNVGEQYQAKDYQEFISLFKFNQENQAYIKEISQVIYKESEDDFFRNLNRKTNMPPIVSKPQIADQYAQDKQTNREESERRKSSNSIVYDNDNNQIDNNIANPQKLHIDTHLTNTINKSNKKDFLESYVDPAAKVSHYLQDNQCNKKMLLNISDNEIQFSHVQPEIFQSSGSTKYKKSQFPILTQRIQDSINRSFEDNEQTKMLQTMARFKIPSNNYQSNNFKQIQNPDPNSSHYISEMERFNNNKFENTNQEIQKKVNFQNQKLQHQRKKLLSRERRRIISDQQFQDREDQKIVNIQNRRLAWENNCQNKNGQTYF